jgi:hypothetical protein
MRLTFISTIYVDFFVERYLTAYNVDFKTPKFFSNNYNVRECEFTSLRCKLTLKRSKFDLSFGQSPGEDVSLQCFGVNLHCLGESVREMM